MARINNSSSKTKSKSRPIDRQHPMNPFRPSKTKASQSGSRSPTVEDCSDATTSVQSSTKAKKSSHDDHVTNSVHDHDNDEARINNYPNESSTKVTKAIVKNSFGKLNNATTAFANESTTRVIKLSNVVSSALTNQEPKKSDAASTSSSSVLDSRSNSLRKNLMLNNLVKKNTRMREINKQSDLSHASGKSTSKQRKKSSLNLHSLSNLVAKVPASSKKVDVITKGVVYTNPKISRHNTFSPSTPHTPKVKGVCSKRKFQEEVSQKINMFMELKKTHTMLSFESFQLMYSQSSTSSQKT